jgi:hypothetical protein
MKLPLSSLENLLELMPPHISEKLKNEKINFDELIEKIKASNYSAQDIFKLTSAPREYHVWIE